MDFSQKIALLILILMFVLPLIRGYFVFRKLLMGNKVSDSEGWLSYLIGWLYFSLYYYIDTSIFKRQIRSSNKTK